MFNSTLVVRDINCPPTCELCVKACASRPRGSGEAEIEKVDLPELGFHSVLTCNQCSQAECVAACPTGALTEEGEGAVALDSGLCIGCNICNLVCPFGGIAPLRHAHRAHKCELCGNPQCAAACPEGILLYKDATVIADNLSEDTITPGLPYCAGCAMELLDRLTLRILGKDIVVFGAPSCNVLSDKFTLPYYGTLMTQAASSATGVSRYFKHIKKETLCVAIIGDGATADLGFGQLSAAAERGEQILYICYDNEAYMNTGIQRSSTTPLGSWTNTTQVGMKGRGRQGEPKNVALLMAFHGIPYTATASLSHPEDFKRKLLKAKEAVKHGMAYIHVLTPCPTGWKGETEDAIELSRKAVDTNYFPLWEAEHGKIKLTCEVAHPLKIEEFINMTKRFSHLTGEEIEAMQTYVNCAYDKVRRIAAAN
jgi:pyruvate/2-oxoacid:ferredoxin oxidoreductase beta subunit/Fe-S-cluster-containing hydrogenase component 2